jgi:hypothetical protein
VAGCEAGLGGKEAAIFGQDLGLEASHFSQRLLELFAGRSHHLVFATSRLAEDVVGALRSRGLEAGPSLESVQEVVRARMPFSGEAFSRVVADRIKQKLLSGMPPGVDGESIEESEAQDPSARGDELYTPEHAYVYRVVGAFLGPLPGIIEMRRRARDLPFVKVKALELQTTPAELPKRF